MRRILILLACGLLLTPFAGFFGASLVVAFLGALVPSIPLTNELLLIGLVVGGFFGSMLAAPVTLAALPLAGWMAPARRWQHLLIILAVGTAAGFASPALFCPTMDAEGTRPVGLWLLGALCGLVVAVPFYFLTARSPASSTANSER